MRKTSLILILLLSFMTNVYAEECSSYQIKTYQQELQNLTYNLTYNENITDMNGELLTGYFNLKISDLPQNYFIAVYNGEGTVFMDEQNNLTLKGGVYNFNVYSEQCDGIIKTFEIRIPHYKEYCELEENCEDDTWFDGTYENTSPIYTEKPKSTTSTRLIIVLASLVIIVTVGFAVTVVIKRRHRL